MKRLFASLLWLSLAASAWADKPMAPEQLPGAHRISAEQAIELIRATPTLIILDSRRQEEHAKGHIEGAISLLDTEMSAAILEMHAPDKKTPLLFYCNGERCLRSSNAATKAMSWGYSNIHWFRGGWEEWLRKELPIAR